MGLGNLFKKQELIKSTFKIDGMHCGMCEAHVCDLIRRNVSIKKVNASHLKNELYIYAKEEIKKEQVENALKNSGYKVL